MRKKNLLGLIASAADICIKPWQHAVIIQNKDTEEEIGLEHFFDLVVRIECRSKDGERFFENDLELDIYRSGSDLNLTLSRVDQPKLPILWQGKHAVWMDSFSGKRCHAPIDGGNLESLARRIRSLFLSIKEDI